MGKRKFEFVLLTRFVRVVHQDAALLSGTIRSNLDPQVTKKEQSNEVEEVGDKNHRHSIHTAPPPQGSDG